MVGPESSKNSVRVCSINKILLKKCQVSMFLSFTVDNQQSGKKENEQWTEIPPTYRRISIDHQE